MNQYTKNELCVALFALQCGYYRLSCDQPGCNDVSCCGIKLQGAQIPDAVDE